MLLIFLASLEGSGYGPVSQSDFLGMTSEKRGSTCENAKLLI